MTIPLEMIHRDDREWLDERHSLVSDDPPPAAHHVFDTLEFGDSRAQVEEKLKASGKEYIELLTSQHGQPIQANDKLGVESIPDNSMSATHIWNI